MTDGLQYLSLARKAGLAELGEEPVGSVTRAGKGALVLVASDASEHTWRRAMSFVAGTKQTCIRIPATKAEMGQAIGRQELAIAAITDPNMALAMVKAGEVCLPEGAILTPSARDVFAQAGVTPGAR